MKKLTHRIVNSMMPFFYGYTDPHIIVSSKPKVAKVTPRARPRGQGPLLWVGARMCEAIPTATHGAITCVSIYSANVDPHRANFTAGSRALPLFYPWKGAREQERGV